MGTPPPPGRSHTHEQPPHPTGAPPRRAGSHGPVMHEDRTKPAAISGEARLVARGSVLNMVAMSLGAALGFAPTVVVSRWLQPSQTGALFELVALFTILSNTLELGADTGLTRWISQARAVGGLAQVRRIVAIAHVPVLILGTAAAADIRIVAPLVPLGALSACALAGARGFGRMWPYLAVEGFGKPALRLGLIFVALIAGWGLRGAVIAWSLPVVAGLAAGWLILAELIKAETRGAGHLLEPRADVRQG